MRSVFCIGVISVLVLMCAVFATPRAFSAPTLVHIPSGASFSDIATILKDANVIYSKTLLRLFVGVTGGADRMRAGEYIFEEAEHIPRVAWRLMQGHHGIEPVRVVLPEGLTIAQMSDVLSTKLIGFDTAQFRRLALGKEGFLFPDTYFFLPNTTPEQVVQTLSLRFDEVVEPLTDDITQSGRSMSDVVVMASILEKEANTFEDKKIVAGILWKRLEIGMALQVDATFMYTLGKASHELTEEDLQTDTPYNTYTRPGLPPAPIANPGLESLQAALAPSPTSHLFYLTGADGAMYYADDFEGHKANKAKYL